ncbi:MAG: hypothetical protein H6991_07790 [Pseudomonadales bacterium]|nr:hypothetical protein [Pseudomonadales bacterium]MCP5187658.1 hypothetical protein [Pseudomonadales bacterium]
MTSEEFLNHQHQTFRYAMSSLLSDCNRRFLRAADLLEVRGKGIEALEQSMMKGGTDLAPLLPAWEVLCTRYREELLSLQQDIFVEGDEQFIKPWTEFLYWHLFPVLRRNNKFVRNILRAVGLLPCHSTADAEQALVAELTEMTLPTCRPDYYESDMDT